MRALERKGQFRALISFVEAWQKRSDPTREALLAQIRAFLSFRATDRAWARLRPLLDDADRPEVFRLAGAILMEQGRYGAAIKLLRRGLERFPDDPELQRELRRSELPSTQIDRTDPLQDNLDGLIRLAEHHLGMGQHVKARALLEKILAKRPDHPRASDLLWVLEGDYDLHGLRLHDLTRVHAPHTPLPTVERDLAEERTEAASMEIPDTPRSSGGFPELFKNLEPQTELQPWSEPEPTRQAHHQELPRWSLHTAQQDTQIERVIHRGNEAQSPLASFDEPTTEVGGEAEDEDVIVRRRREILPSPERTETYRPLVVDPARERLPPGVPRSDEAADFVRLPPPEPAEVPLEEQPTVPAPPPPPPPRPALDPASLPPPLTDEFDLSDLYPHPTVSLTGWIVLGLLLGTATLAVLVLIALATLW